MEINSYQDNLAFALTNPTHTSPKGYLWNRKWSEGQTKWRKYLSTGIVYNQNTTVNINRNELYFALVNQFSMSFVDGTNGNKAIEDSSMLQFIKEGKRTQTSRDISKSYNIGLSKLNIGDYICFVDKNKDSPTYKEKIICKITDNNIPINKMKSDEFVEQEHWQSSVYDKLKDKKYVSTRFEYIGQWFIDVEQAYQCHKIKSNNEQKYHLMKNILVQKLLTYPKLVEGIEHYGGVDWLEKCTHQPTKKKTFWETTGQNKFIQCLVESYKLVKNML